MHAASTIAGPTRLPKTMLGRDPRLKTVQWRDLVEISVFKRLYEATLPVPWLVFSCGSYAFGAPVVGAIGSFFFFLTGLRLSHNCQHYALGGGRRWQDLMLFVLSPAMLASMHAVQVTHLHHHRHCLDEDDIEASHIGKPVWRVLLEGPVFPLRLHASAWRIGGSVKRRWIAAELGVMATLIGSGLMPDAPVALRWHLAAMLAGQCLTAFFAVWTVHHGCDHHSQIARTQRGWLRNVVSYSMFYHLEHHLFPAVPTCNLHRLAMRLDDVAPEYAEKQVIGAGTTGRSVAQPVTGAG